MKRRRHTPEQVIRKLAEADKLLAEGKTVEEACRHLEITESTYHRWRNQYGGMKANDAKWASSALTDIHHQGHSPRKDVQNGDHRTEEAPCPSVVHPGVQG
jgi:transposase-like protein